MELLFETGGMGSGEKELPTTIKSDEELARYSVRVCVCVRMCTDRTSQWCSRCVYEQDEGIAVSRLPRACPGQRVSVRVCGRSRPLARLSCPHLEHRLPSLAACRWMST